MNQPIKYSACTWTQNCTLNISESWVEVSENSVLFVYEMVMADHVS
jgi:hypothetical protein